MEEPLIRQLRALITQAVATRETSGQWIAKLNERLHHLSTADHRGVWFRPKPDRRKKPRA